MEYIGKYVDVILDKFGFRILSKHFDFEISPSLDENDYNIRIKLWKFEVGFVLNYVKIN